MRRLRDGKTESETGMRGVKVMVRAILRDCIACLALHKRPNVDIHTRGLHRWRDNRDKEIVVSSDISTMSSSVPRSPPII